MPLFEDKPRARQEPKKQGESDFSFYDSCAWPEMETYRQLVNGWIEEFPEAECAEMIARMKDSDTTYYQAALAEAMMHAVFLKLGYKVEIHPNSPHPTRKPDFLVKKDDGSPVAYLEVTTFGPTNEAVGMSNREATIYNAIDKSKLPAGFRLSYEMLARGATSPNVGKLCAEVEEWAAESAQDDPEVMPVKTFMADDWQIELILVGGFKKDVVAERSIGSAMGDLRQVNADIEIRAALKKKGGRYGDFAHPYIIAVVDCKNELAGGDSNAEHFIEAVHGTVYTEVRTFADGAIETEDKRRSNGYWGRPDSPQHPNVSAAILLPRPHLWDLRQDRWQPLIMRHPWATHPLPEDVLPLPGWKLNEQGEFAPIDGVRLADILGLPDPWPPEPSAESEAPK